MPSSTLSYRFELVQHGSPAYWQTVALRDEILRRPLGLQFTPEQLAVEAMQHHLACYSDEITADLPQLLACLILQKADIAGFIKMRQVAVTEIYQRQGVGAALCQFAEQWAVEQGFAHIYCHARDTAAPFYKKLGYCIEGEPFSEVGIIHYKMSKTIRA